MEIIWHQNKGIFRLKWKSFTVNRIFRVLLNTHFYEKAFPEMIWSQNKHNLSIKLVYNQPSRNFELGV